MEKTFNTEPKNELEVRLVCVDMAMQIVMNGNIDKTDTILDSAEKILKFVTNDGTISPTGLKDVIETVKPFIDTLTQYINEAENHQVPVPTEHEVAVVAEDAPAEKSPKSSKK